MKRRETPCVRPNGRVFEASVGVSAIRDTQQEATWLFAQIETLIQTRTCRVVKQAQLEMLARLASAAELPDDETGAHAYQPVQGRVESGGCDRRDDQPSGATF